LLPEAVLSLLGAMVPAAEGVTGGEERGLLMLEREASN